MTKKDFFGYPQYMSVAVATSFSDQFKAKIRFDLAPWEKVAEKVSYLGEVVKYKILKEDNIDPFDVKKNLKEGNVLYFCIGRVEGACKFVDFPNQKFIPPEFYEETDQKKALKLTIEIFNKQKEKIKTFQYKLGNN